MPVANDSEDVARGHSAPAPDDAAPCGITESACSGEVGDLTVERSRIAGLPVSLTTWEAVETWARATIDAKGSATVCTVAPYQAYLADQDDDYRRCLEAASLVLVDGNGVRLLLAIAGVDPGERMTGRELVERVYGGEFLRGVRVAVVGGMADTLARLADDRPEWQLFGEQYADRPDGAVDDLAARLSTARAELVLVALGSPKMELWADALSRRHRAIYASVGGAVDTVTGVRKAPPASVSRLGLEWAWRAAQDPSLYPRLGRALSVMPRLVVRAVGERRGLPGSRNDTGDRARR